MSWSRVPDKFKLRRGDYRDVRPLCDPLPRERERQAAALQRYVAEQRSETAPLIGKPHTKAQKRRARRPR